MKNNNLFFVVAVITLMMALLMLSGCSSPAATTPPSSNVSINKYFITGTAPTAVITSSVNNPFTNNLSVVSLVPASKTTFFTITKTTSVTSPTFYESITSSTAASFNALMIGGTTGTQTNTILGLNTVQNTISDALTAESAFRERETQLLTSTHPVSVSKFGLQQQALMMTQSLVTASSGSTASFNVAQFASDSTTYTGNLVVNATCQYVGNNAYIFVDNNAIAANPTTYAASSAQLAAISTAFDAIYTTDRATFGSEWGGGAPGDGSGGIDGDPKIYILISPAVNSNGINGFLGYFYRIDETTLTAAPNYSNKHEMFYVVTRQQGGVSDLWDDANTTANNATIGYNILAHEFQHMINFNTKYGHNGLYNGVLEDTWLNEGLSMYAMQACGYGLPNALHPDTTTANHVRNYLAAPHLYSLTTWSSGNYGMSYLFVLYLIEHYGGSGILAGMESNSLTGISNVESVTGAGTFGLVFKNWVMANYLDHITTNATYNYTSISLRGTYAGLALNGAQPVVVNTTYPFNATGTQPGWSVMYQEYTNATNALNISIQNYSGYNYLEGVVMVQ